MAVGLDIGTCFLVAARQDGAQVKIDSVRDAFLDIEAETSTLNMLKMSNTSFVQEGDNVYIVGEPALGLANLMKREARRPLCQGIIAPGELEAEKMLLILIKSILRTPSVENEVVFYSVPAKPIDRDVDVIYHEAMFRKIVESFGFKAKAMNEAAAIVYSNAVKEGFTAMATSFGAGMSNTALVFQTMVGTAFSLSKGGDWIDSSAAKAVGSTATRIMSIKEKGVDLLNPSEGDPKTLREREAIVVYYRNLIRSVIDGIKREFKRGTSKIELPNELPWIISGGTAKAKNFLEFFKQTFEAEKATFPVGISEIRMAQDPLNDVAKGLLIAAMND